jgi:hypothetical protein
MDNDFQKSINRAMKLMGTPSDYENYVVIKIKPVRGGCCCFHCWPKTWSVVNKYIAPFGPLEDEGDVLINKDQEKYVLECHESGPEIILYGIISGIIAGLVVESVVGLVTTFLESLQNEDRKRPGALRILRRRQIKGQTEEEEIMEIDLPLSKDVIKKLNDNIRKVIEKNKK